MPGDPGIHDRAGARPRPYSVPKDVPRVAEQQRRRFRGHATAGAETDVADEVLQLLAARRDVAAGERIARVLQLPEQGPATFASMARLDVKAFTAAMRLSMVATIPNDTDCLLPLPARSRAETLTWCDPSGSVSSDTA